MERLLEDLRREEAKAAQAELGAGFRADIRREISRRESTAARAGVDTDAATFWRWLPLAWADLLGRPGWIAGCLALGLVSAGITAQIVQSQSNSADNDRLALHLTAFSPYAPEGPEGLIYQGE